MPRRRSGDGALDLLQKWIKFGDDWLKKNADRRSIIFQKNLAEKMETEMVKLLNKASTEHADLIEKLQQIREKLVNEEFLCVAMESDIAEVSNFRKHGYRGGVKIVGNSVERRQLLERFAFDCEFKVIA